MKQQTPNPTEIDSEKEKMSIPRLLRFNPDLASTIAALLLWAGIIGLIAIVIMGGLVLGQDAFAEEWQPALTHPSSILIGDNDIFIRLHPGEEACRITFLPGGSEQLLCTVPFENASLTLNVEREDGTFWRTTCSAEYGGQPVPCRASFDNLDYETFVVIQSNLALSEERFRQLAEDSMNQGWGEKETIWLVRGLVAMISLVVFGLLWRHSAKRTNGQSHAAVLRVAYAAGISLMIFVIANYVAALIMLVFNLID